MPPPAAAPRAGGGKVAQLVAALEGSSSCSAGDEAGGGPPAAAVSEDLSDCSYVAGGERFSSELARCLSAFPLPHDDCSAGGAPAPAFGDGVPSASAGASASLPCDDSDKSGAMLWFAELQQMALEAYHEGSLDDGGGCNDSGACKDDPQPSLLDLEFVGPARDGPECDMLAVSAEPEPEHPSEGCESQGTGSSTSHVPAEARELERADWGPNTTPALPDADASGLCESHLHVPDAGHGAGAVEHRDSLLQVRAVSGRADWGPHQTTPAMLVPASVGHRESLLQVRAVLERVDWGLSTSSADHGATGAGHHDSLLQLRDVLGRADWGPQHSTPALLDPASVGHRELLLQVRAVLERADWGPHTTPAMLDDAAVGHHAILLQVRAVLERADWGPNTTPAGDADASLSHTERPSRTERSASPCSTVQSESNHWPKTSVIEDRLALEDRLPHAENSSVAADYKIAGLSRAPSKSWADAMDSQSDDGDMAAVDNDAVAYDAHLALIEKLERDIAESVQQEDAAQLRYQTLSNQAYRASTQASSLNAELEASRADLSRAMDRLSPNELKQLQTASCAEQEALSKLAALQCSGSASKRALRRASSAHRDASDYLVRLSRVMQDRQDRRTLTKGARNR